MAATSRNPVEVFTLEDVQQVLRERSGSGPDSATAPAGTAPAPRKPDAEGKSRSTAERRAASIVDILGFDPHAAPASSRPGKKDAIPARWHRHFDALVKMRDELLRRLRRHRAETLRGSDGDGLDRAKMLDQHGVDGAAEQADLERAMSFVENEQELLREVEAALERLHRGTYGTCEQTGEAIGAERLTALPFARYSLRGQEEHERSRLSSKNRDRNGPLFAIGDEDEEPLGSGEGAPEE
ncbi:MAG: TraR/DksA C4-type zinc finger protein [Puniceicoccales bacterium]|nr:TraR/DksA C4-type zinc finger protein [Puniceicoccales bacterium]